MQVAPQFRRERCLRYRYRYSDCARCLDACPHEAVSLSDEGATLDPARCQNCALCVGACATEALVAENRPPIDLLRQAAGRTDFAFACAPSGEAGDARVPCLGALDGTMLAYLASRGVAVELRGAGHCGDCPHGVKGAALARSALDAQERLHAGLGGDAWPKAALAQAAEESTAPKTDPARRHLFRRLAGRAAGEVAQANAPLQPDPVPLKAVRAAAPHSTVRRELIQAIWPKEGEGELPCDPLLPLAEVRLGTGCNACEVCARACPTGALAVRESQARWEIAFRAARCVACGLCLEACQPGALAFADAVSLAAPRRAEGVTLLGLDKRRCTGCDRFFITAGDESLCPACEGDGEDFASIFG